MKAAILKAVTGFGIDVLLSLPLVLQNGALAILKLVQRLAEQEEVL